LPNPKHCFLKIAPLLLSSDNRAAAADAAASAASVVAVDSEADASLALVEAIPACANEDAAAEVAVVSDKRAASLAAIAAFLAASDACCAFWESTAELPELFSETAAAAALAAAAFLDASAKGVLFAYSPKFQRHYFAPGFQP
jgi:plasmid replication initiation protein